MPYKIIKFDPKTKYCTVAFDITNGKLSDGRQNRIQTRRRIPYDPTHTPPRIPYDAIEKTELEIFHALKQNSPTEISTKNRVKFATFATILDYYKTDQIRNGCKYPNSWDAQIKIICEYFGSKTPIETLTRPQLKDFRQYLKETRKITDNTVNRYFALIRAAVNLAVEDVKITDSPVKKFPMITVRPKARRQFTRSEFEKLIEVLSPNLQDIIYALIYTGIRLGRVLSLRWDQIDLLSQPPRLTVLKKDPKIKEGVPETFYITPTLLKILVRRKQNSNSEYVFPNSNDPTRPLGSIKKSFKIALRKAQLPPGLTIHGLRHSFITGLNNQHVGLDTRQRLAGHSTPAMTEYYTHPDDLFLYEETCKIEKEYPPLYNEIENPKTSLN